MTLKQTYRTVEQLKRIQKSRKFTAKQNLEGKLPNTPIEITKKELDENHEGLMKTNPFYKKLTHQYEKLVKKFNKQISYRFN